MDSEKLNQAIDLDTEIVELRDILNAIGEEPYLCFHFTGTSRGTSDNFIIKEEKLVCDILRLIGDRRCKLEKEFGAL